MITRAKELASSIAIDGDFDLRDLASTDYQSKNTHYWPDSSPHSRAFQARFPDSNQLIKMARLAVDGRIQFWHPWHMEPTHVPLLARSNRKWFAVRYGDLEWTHALLRFNHVFDLGAACALTGEPEFLRAIARELISFASARLRHKDHRMLQNQLDAALRVHQLVRTHDLIKNDPCMHPELSLLAGALTLNDCRFLFRHLGERVGNWEFFIATALLVAVEYFSSWPQSAEWNRRAYRRLSEILASEISGDGIEMEESPMYAGECVLTILDYLLIRASNSRPLPSEVEEKLSLMLEALDRLKDPCHRIPAIGDSDALDFQYVMTYAEGVLGHPISSQKTRATHSAEEAQRDKHVALAPFPDTGWGVSRWRGPSDTQWYLLFDASGRPPERRSWHAHADDLQILLHSSKTDLFVDPGRYTYASHYSSSVRSFAAKIGVERVADRAGSVVSSRAWELNRRDWRAYFRHTLQHNTVSCNGRNQSGYDTARPPGSKRGISCQRASGPIILLEGSTAGEPATDSQSDRPLYRHTRTVLVVAPIVVILVDNLEAPESCDWTASLHLHPDVSARRASDRMVLVAPGIDEPCLFFAASAGGPDVRIDDDWVSPVYNRKVRSKTIRATAYGVQTTQLVTVALLSPLKERVSDCQCVIRFGGNERGPQPSAVIIDIHENDSRQLLGISQPGGVRENHEISTDGRVAMLRYEGDVLGEVGLLGGTSVCAGGREIIARPNIGDYFESF